MKTRLNGTELSFEARGHGLPIVLLHGFPLSREIWQPQVEALCEEFCVIAPDLRGHGESAAPAGVYAMETFAEDVFALLQHLLSPPAVIAGHSMGGYVAFAFLRKYPDWVKGLVLVSTRGGADSPEGKAGREALAQAVGEEKSAAPVVAKMLPNMMAPQSISDHPSLKTEVERIMANTSLHGLAGALRGMAVRFDVQDVLATIRVPVLIVAGTADGLIPHAESEKMAAAITNAELQLIEGAGHLPSLEQPDQMNRVLKQWLRRAF